MEQIILAIPAELNIDTLDLQNTGLSVVPPGLTKFLYIQTLSLSRNNLNVIKTGDLVLKSASLSWLLLSDSNIQIVEDNSLPGVK